MSHAKKRRSAHTAGGWSQHVTETSRALQLEEGVFTWDDPVRIARSLKQSAEQSTTRKAEPYRSALSMLVFYINRAGSNLPPRRKVILERAKIELGKLFGDAKKGARRRSNARAPGVLT